MRLKDMLKILHNPDRLRIYKTTHGGIVLWQLDIEIPRAFLGLSPHAPVLGNLYKCASSAPVPHYLCAFPISTPAPDFHRPEFFRDIWDG